MGFHSFFQHEFVEQDPKYSLSKGQQVHLCAFQFTHVSTEDNNTYYQVDIKLKEGEDMKTWHKLMSLNMLPHPPSSAVTESCLFSSPTQDSVDWVQLTLSWDSRIAHCEPSKAFCPSDLSNWCRD